MKEITLVMIRHSKSCANHVRDIAGTHDTEHPLAAASQQIRDPALSAHGAAMARAYSPTLRARLQRMGLPPLSTVAVGSSGLRRARETASLLFPTIPASDLVHFPHIKEFGNIPENTPARLRRDKPDFRAFLRHLHDLPQTTFVVVAHGSFLRSEAWPTVAPRRPHGRFGNLDAFIVRTGLTEDGRLLSPRTTDLPWSGRHPTGTDRCSRRVERLIGRHTRKNGTGSKEWQLSDSIQRKVTPGS
jgi:broad specificity phosphatase PhoE